VISLALVLLSSVYAQVNIETVRHQKNSNGLSNMLDLRWNYRTGNSNYSIGDVSYRVDSITNGIHSFIIASFSQGNSDGDIIENEGFFHIRTVLELTPIRFLELYTQNEYDQFRDLKNRKLVGTGFRFLHTSSDRLHIYTGHSVMIETEHYENDTVTNLLRLSEYLNLTYDTDSADVSFIIYLQPDLGRPEDFRILSDFTWKMPLSNAISLSSSISYSYDNEPEEGLQNGDFGTKTGLSIQF